MRRTHREQRGQWRGVGKAPFTAQETVPLSGVRGWEHCPLPAATHQAGHSGTFSQPLVLQTMTVKFRTCLRPHSHRGQSGLPLPPSPRRAQGGQGSGCLLDQCLARLPHRPLLTPRPLGLGLSPSKLVPVLGLRTCPTAPIFRGCSPPIPPGWAARGLLPDALPDCPSPVCFPHGTHHHLKSSCHRVPFP